MNNENLEGEFLEYASIVKLTEGQEMTLLEMNAAFTTLKNGVDLFKTWGDLKDVNALRIIASMERELFNLETELLKKDKEIVQLKEQLASIDKPKLVEQLIYKGSLWFVKDDESQIPVCRNCTEEKDKYVYAIKTPIGWQCQTCKAPMR